MSIPAGGTIAGYGETFSASSFTGTASFSIPIFLSQARQPLSLDLAYTSGGGNGPFGVGWNAGVESIARRTDRGIPRYDDTDTFLFGGEELVPALEHTADGWQPIVREATLDGVVYVVRTYRPRVESDFTRIERWTAEANELWKTYTPDGSIAIFGMTAAARIADPADATRVFQWLIESTLDQHGNRVLYRYKQENDEGAIRNVGDADRSYTANRYLEKIFYGNYTDANGDEAFTFQAVFDYGEYDPLSGSAVPVRPWTARLDCFSVYRPGFEVRTCRLCRGVMAVHDFPDDAVREQVVAYTAFEYDETSARSLLVRTQRTGMRMDGGVLSRRSMPPIDLTYSGFHPEQQTFRPLALSGAPVPGLLDGGLYRLVDLYGEGLPGVLYTDGRTMLYWRPLGQGLYAAPEPLPVLPADVIAGTPAFALVDLDANGHLDVVVTTEERAGFYLNQEAGWQPYQDFPRFAPEMLESRAQLVDLNGNGLTDIFVQAGTATRYYASRGIEGFAPPVVTGVTEPVPPPSAASERIAVFFADVFGDGLSHRVLVSDGNVTVWPNLGYGNFAPPVTFANAPAFGSDLTAGRIFLADVTGTGPSDLLFVYPDHLELYPNESGNGFGTGLRIDVPFGINALDQVSFADVLGHGTASFVVSRATPEVEHSFFDFAGALRPDVLVSMDNNFGLRTELSYRSSTEYYLRDQEAGRPWVTRLSTPVWVLETVTTIDEIANSENVRTFQYRDGYFDPVARVFRGFGFVQTQDTLVENTGLWSFAAPAGATPSGVQPAFTRAWHLTGAYVENQDIEAQARAEYWHGDPDALSLPPTSFDPEIFASDAATIREAYAALANFLIHQELFGVRDDGSLESAPLDVTESAYQVKLLQPRFAGHAAVFYVLERESSTSRYDAVADDPRIEYTAVLEVDEYGFETRKATVAYPRRAASSPIPQQTDLLITATLAEAADLTGDDVYILSEQYFRQELELSGVEPQGRYFTFAELAAGVALALADTIAFGTPFTPGLTQARLSTWSEIYFWNAGQTAMLPLGALAAPPLVHHGQEAVFPPQVVSEVYGTRVTDAMLTGAKYELREGYWWSRGNTMFYFDASGFSLLRASTDPFGNTASNTYDRYFLAIVTMTDALGQTVTVTTDYQANEPKQVRDVNDNLSQAIYDPLGNVTVTSITAKKNGVASGNMDLADYVARPVPTFDEVLADSDFYLQGASTYYLYELDTWNSEQQPPHAVTLVREDFYYDDAGNPVPATRIRKIATYSNGAMRQLLAKTAVEADATLPADLPPGSGAIVWVESSRLTYDDRGDVIRRYLSAFTTTARYEPDTTAPFFLYHYDALHRLIRTDTPKGFFTRTEYGSWNSTHYDEDDTVKESQFYRDNIGNTNPDFAAERAALIKAAFFENTPMTTSFNPFGFPVQALRRNRWQEGLVIIDQELRDTFWVDTGGQVERAADARFYDPAHPDQPTHLSATNVYDMPGDPLRSWSCDAGARLTLRDVLGSTIDSWDDRGYHVTTFYDPLRRVVASGVEGNGLDQLFERITYGTDPIANTVNEIVQRLDPSGVATFTAYDILGYATASTRRFVADYTTLVNWDVPADVKLMDETWTLGWRQNAAGQTVEKHNADGSTTRFAFWVNGWLKTVTLQVAGAPSPAAVVDVIRYNAQGESQQYAFGNGVVSDYVFDPKDFRPIAIDSQAPNGDVLQKVRTTYDPVGNVVSIEDRFVPPGFTPSTEQPTNDYTYDAVYQLRVAVGREEQTPDALRRYDETYAYDEGANLVAIEHVVPGDPSGDWTREIAVSDSSNRAVPKPMTEGGKKPDDFFDANGNQLELATGEVVERMAWDFRGCLTSVTLDDSGTTEFYLCEGPGDRSRKVLQIPNADGSLSIVDTLYIGDAIIVLGGTVTGGVRAITDVEMSVNVHAGDDLVLVTTGTTEPVGVPRTWRWQLLNPVHSVVLETNELAALTTYEEYFPFGSTSASAGDPAALEQKRYRFTSKERDEATQLYAIAARYYISWIGRWTSPDPAGASDGLNLYAYVRNNPTSLIDPNGTNGTPDARTKPLPIYSLSTSTAEMAQLYGYVTPTHQEYYGELTTRMQQSIYLRPDLSSSSSTQRFHPEVEKELWDVLEIHRGLHVASVPALMKSWQEVVDNYTGAKTGSALYTAMRSKFSPELNSNPVLDFKDAQYIRPPELHHLIYKSIRPEYAVQPWNLMLATRGSSSSGLVGLHEGVFHKLGSAGDSNLYSVLNPGFERLVLSWSGQAPSFYPTPVYSSAPSSVDDIVQKYSSARLWGATTGSSSTLATVPSIVSITPMVTTPSITPSTSSPTPIISKKKRVRITIINDKKSYGGVTKSKNKRKYTLRSRTK